VRALTFGDERARGVVLALSDGWATLMSPDGSFRRVHARPAWRVGDDVLVPSEVSRLRRSAPWLGSAAAAVAAAAVTFGVMSSLAANRPVLDVEISGGHTVTLAANADGQVLTFSSDLPVPVHRGESLATAVEEVARAEGTTPAGDEGGTLVVFYAPKNGKPAANLGRTLHSAEVAAGLAGAQFVTDVSAPDAR
jgi:hypothetical protein